MSLQVIGGLKRGAKLRTPEGTEVTRPLRGRIRESLFNILREDVPGAQVLDAFAGSGAVGLEALSRGAAHCTFVEPADEALRALEWNIKHLRFESQTRVVRSRMPDACERLNPLRGGFNIAFLMPPYHSGLGIRCLESAVFRRLLVPEDSVVILEVDAGETLETVAGWNVVDERRYGVTRLLFYTPA